MDKRNVNYEYLKWMAKRLKVKVGTTIALAMKNDPFFMGKPSEIEKAEWFVGIWERFGEEGEHYLRGIHYKMVVQADPVSMPDGKSYENTDVCWAYLNAAAKYARYLGKVDFDLIEDRRNPDPIINDELPEYGPWYHIETHDDIRFGFPELPPLPHIMLTGFDPIQKYHMEVWCEKTSMNHILKPLCEEYGIDLITGMGEMSVHAAVQALRRSKALSKSARIFYISDFDPTGHGMPVSMSRKVEFFCDEDDDIKVWPIALTEDQVKEFRLPRVPIKATERRKANWEKRFGEDAVELDALEALHPGSLKEIVEEWILEFYDEDLHDRNSEMALEIHQNIRRIQNKIEKRYQNELDDLKSQHEELRAVFMEKIKAVQKKQVGLYDNIMNELGKKKPDSRDLEPAEAEDREASTEALFSTNRDYFKQLKIYKQYQKKEDEIGWIDDEDYEDDNGPTP